MKKCTDGGYIILGDASDSLGVITGVVKTNNQGDLIWKRTFGGSSNGIGNIFAYSIDLTIDGGYIITVTSSPYGDIGLIKLDANGFTTSTYNIPINLTQGKLLKTVDLLGRETKGKTNQPLFYIYDDGTVEKKIIIE